MIALGRYFVFVIFVTATMSSPPKFTDVDLVPFLYNIFNIHNDYRGEHGVNHLYLDENLSNDAKQLLIRIHDKKPIPQDKGMNIGNGKIENISDLNTEEAKKLFLKWYDTGAGYDYDNEPSKEIAKSAAPFTQILWKNTKRMGITGAMKEDGTYDILVIYSPKGNKKKHYKHNVSRLKKK